MLCSGNNFHSQIFQKAAHEGGNCMWQSNILLRISFDNKAIDDRCDNLFVYCLDQNRQLFVELLNEKFVNKQIHRNADKQHCSITSMATTIFLFFGTCYKCKFKSTFKRNDLRWTNDNAFRCSSDSMNGMHEMNTAFFSISYFISERCANQHVWMKRTNHNIVHVSSNTPRRLL